MLGYWGTGQNDPAGNAAPGSNGKNRGKKAHRKCRGCPWL